MNLEHLKSRKKLKAGTFLTNQCEIQNAKKLKGSFFFHVKISKNCEISEMEAERRIMRL